MANTFITTGHDAVERTYTEITPLSDGRRVFRDMSKSLEEPVVIVVGHQNTKKGQRAIVQQSRTVLDADGITPRVVQLALQPQWDPKVVTAAMLRLALSELYSLLDDETSWSQFIQGWSFA